MSPKSRLLNKLFIATGLKKVKSKDFFFQFVDQAVNAERQVR
jgi:hypothetical protein